jgi:hypothetical protein
LPKSRNETNKVDKSRSFRDVHDTNCRPDALCVACALILVARHRFAAFYEKFGRWPEPDDELFFDGAKSAPVRASKDQVMRQILEAAETHDLRVAPLLTFFGIAPDID